MLSGLRRLMSMLRKQAMGLANEGSASGGSPAPETPHCQKEKRARAEGEGSLLLGLPDELLEQIVVCDPSVSGLCTLACTHPRLRALAEGTRPWRELCAAHYGEPTEVQELGAELAGGWKALFAAKTAAMRAAAPWERPSAYEVEAAVRHMAGARPGGTAPPRAHEAHEAGASDDGEELACVFLVDGSGSVTEEDFGVMQSFLSTAAALLGSPPAGAAAAGGAGAAAPPLARPARFAIVQFSNDTRVERGLAPAPAPGSEAAHELDALLAGMRRMNGGTNIAAAFQKAGQLLKPLGRRGHRVLALLTDGRVDSYQAREVSAMAQRMADEQGETAVYAFGVGRGVDKSELLRIVSATCGASPKAGAPAPPRGAGRWGAPPSAGAGASAGAASPDGAAACSKEVESRYLGLCVLDEAPW